MLSIALATEGRQTGQKTWFFSLRSIHWHRRNNTSPEIPDMVHTDTNSVLSDMAQWSAMGVEQRKQTVMWPRETW